MVEALVRHRADPSEWSARTAQAWRRLPRSTPRRLFQTTAVPAPSRTFLDPSSAMSSDTTQAAHGTSRLEQSVLCNGVDTTPDAQATTTERPPRATVEDVEEETPALPPRLDSRTDALLEPLVEHPHAQTENEHPQVALLRGMFPDFDNVILYAPLPHMDLAVY